MGHWTSPFKASHFHFTDYFLDELCLQAQVPYQAGNSFYNRDYMATNLVLILWTPALDASPSRIYYI